MTPRNYTMAIGVLAVLLGGLILIRDLLQIHSIPYGIAGVGLVAFGAWRFQVARRIRP
jgi:hypothetical protein